MSTEIKPGLHWIREKGTEEWLIASVKGVAPFLRVRVWNPENNYVAELKHPEGWEFGASVPPAFVQEHKVTMRFDPAKSIEFRGSKLPDCCLTDGHHEACKYHSRFACSNCGHSGGGKCAFCTGGIVKP